MQKVLLIMFPFFVAIFLFHYFLVGQAVYGDGIYYWSYVRSIVIDHDLRLNDEISHHYDHLHNNINIKDVIPKEDASRIALEYHLPFGPSLGWLPFFLIADGIAHIVHLFNPQIATNGYSDIYQISVGIGNIVYMLLGLYFIFLLLKNYVSEKTAIVTTLLLFFASNLLYYGSSDVINSHPFALFLSSFLAYYFFCKFSNKWHEWILLGTLIGGLILTRTQEVVFSIFILAAVIKYKNFLFGLLGIVGIVIIVFPQLFLLHDMYHGIFNSPYLLSHGFTFLSPHIFGVLLNSKTGLLFTSPIILVGVIGLIFLALQKKYIGILGLVLFLTEYYLIASWYAWDQAASYGIRMLITTFPLVAVGLAYSVERVAKKFGFTCIYIIGVLLCIFNVAMIVRFHLSVKTVTKDDTSITRLVAQKKFNQVFHTHFEFFRE